MDTAFTMPLHQFIHITKRCCLQLSSVSQTLQHLTQEAAEKLKHAFVASTWGIMSSLLNSVTSDPMQEALLIQNNTARIASQQRKSCHITLLLQNLHWLPVQANIEFKTPLCLQVREWCWFSVSLFIVRAFNHSKGQSEIFL